MRRTAYQELLDAEETRHGLLRLTIQHPNLTHLNRFVELRCAPDLLALGIYPDAKEISESMAAFAAVKRLDLDPKDPTITAVCVGDGATPRTAALFAFRTAWQVHSVDPIARDTDWSVRRLTVHRAKVEDVRIESAGPGVVVAVHSHAPIGPSIACLSAPIKHVVAMPCCVDLHGGMPQPDHCYDDWGCFSGNRRVLVWGSAA